MTKTNNIVCLLLNYPHNFPLEAKKKNKTKFNQIYLKREKTEKNV